MLRRGRKLHGMTKADIERGALETAIHKRPSRCAASSIDMKSLLVMMVLATQVACAAAKDLAAYRNTNELVWDEGFRASVAQFFGKQRASYFWRDGLLSDQVLEGLGGPPDEVERIEGMPLFMASACRHHSCPEKVAVVLRDSSHPIAFGVVHYACFHQHANATCSERPTLLILSKGSVVEPKVKEAIVHWAVRAVGDLQAVNAQVVR